MSKKILKGIGIGIVTYAAIGAGIVMYYPDEPDSMGWEDRQDFNRVQIDKLEQNEHWEMVTHQKVLDILGGPDISEAKITGEDKIQVMYYRTQRKKADGLTSQDECTPLLFKNDKLVALGEKAEDQFENAY